MRHFTFALALTAVAAAPAFADTGATKPTSAAPTAAHAAPAAPAPAAAPTAPATGMPAKASIDWDGMNAKQRKTYMKKTVQPAMQKLFAEYDAKRYKKITCMTCHGEGANKDFKMPNPALPKLPTDAAGFKALQEKKPEAVKFMGTKVKPAMAALLGMPEFHPEHPVGFGCYNCHTKDAAAAPAAPAK